MSPNDPQTQSPELTTISHLTSSSAPSTTSTATALTTPISDALHANAPTAAIEQRLWALWNALIHHATQTPPQQGQARLHQLLQTIQQLPREQHRENGAEPKIFNKKLWADLPVFGAAMRESWDKKSLQDPARMADPAAHDEWVNLNAFAARLTADATPASDATDFALFAVWTLRESLEDPAQASMVSAPAVRAASVWFEYAAQRLWGLCKEGRTFEGKVAREGEAFRGREWRGFGEERWRAWMQRLHQVLEVEEADAAAKKAATVAVREMARAMEH